ncbi:MAG: polysaccharide pyruvyl transferase family protein [candidate division KSB1 bacterium]|nr:polysaccharide pyruvyl transferase family protein [candidate division KSB1 bacterium]MDZ7345804.1 polysaccharide pyruvyl transferase family protein [candidate division KSB1 bacterium]
MKITFITTIRHNIGDDWVRMGLQFILQKALKSHKLSFSCVHKHTPITSRIGFGRLRRLRGLNELLPLRFTGDRILQADWVIQSGAPVYWCHETVGAHCCENEWYEPLVRRRINAFRIPFYNIAGGSCQTFHSNGSEVCDRCRNYIREFFDSCRLTTLRDQLAAAILHSVGRDAPVLPCTSLFSVDANSPSTVAEDYVAVNFMPLGGHYTFGQPIDRRKWFQQFASFYAILKKEHRVVFACHNAEERRWAKTIDPQARIFFSANRPEPYIAFYAGAKAGVFNRIHGAFIMAALGKPSLTVGVDSRARILQEIGLPTLYVNDATAENMMDIFNGLVRKRLAFADQMRTIKEQTLESYVGLLSS